MPSSVDIVAAVTSNIITDTILNTQVSLTNSTLPVSSSPTSSPSSTVTNNLPAVPSVAPLSSGSPVSTVYLEKTPGQFLPLIPVSNFQSGTYANVNTGETLILTGEKLPLPGIYRNLVDNSIIVVTRNETTNEIVVMSGGTSSTTAAVGGNSRVARPSACK